MPVPSAVLPGAPERRGGGVALRPAVRGAVLVALVLRLVWVGLASQPPSNVLFSDSASYLRNAAGFVDGHTPRIGGRPTAFQLPGYSLVLVPLEVVDRITGGTVDVVSTAGVLNAVAGAATVAGVARVARRRTEAPADAVAAWVLALSPSQIYFTSAVLSETIFTALLVGAVVWLDDLRGRSNSDLGRWVAWGALAGFTMLVRSPGILLLGLAAVVLLGERPRLRVDRRLVALTFGAVLVLAPWAVRNGVEVGVWTPLGTGGVDSMCLSHRDGADGLASFDAAVQRACYRGSPFDDPALYRGLNDADRAIVPRGVIDGRSRVDEPEWYRRTAADALSWAVRNPGKELTLAARKTAVILGSDRDAFDAAEDFSQQPLVSPKWRHRLIRLADVWWWTVLGLALVGFATVGRLRRARVLWAMPAGILAVSLAGVAFDRYHHPMVPWLVVAAASVVTLLERWSSRS